MFNPSVWPPYVGVTSPIVRVIMKADDIGVHVSMSGNCDLTSINSDLFRRISGALWDFQHRGEKP